MCQYDFYFTYGTDECYPYRGGWTKVVVFQDIPEELHDEIKEIGKARLLACSLFDLYHPNPRHKNLLNCADIYYDDEFTETDMYKYDDNLGAGEQEKICCGRVEN